MMTAEETSPLIRPAGETNKPLTTRALRTADDDCGRLKQLSALGLEPRNYGLKVYPIGYVIRQKTTSPVPK